MLIIGSILFALRTSTPSNAAPSSSPSPSTTDHLHFYISRDSGLEDPCTRKPLEIAWSCIATILAASWVSVHPNMPHPDDSRLKKSLRRVELMVWAIIAPELIIYWAMRQWAGARQMEKEFEEYLNEDSAIPNSDVTKPEATCHQSSNLKASESQASKRNSARHGFKWSRTHGFFLQMGGFMLYENGTAKYVLGWKTIMEHYKAGRIDLSTVTEARISDQSKADGFAKGLALLQTFWFIAQCTARLLDTRFLLTELELITVALAILSLVMYLLWWNKPFNVEVPIMILIRETERNGNINVNKSDTEVTSGIKEKSLFADLKDALYQFKNIFSRLGEITNSDGSPIIFSFRFETELTPLKKLPTFYSVGSHIFLSDLRMRLSSFFIASFFGAIHCVGWSKKITFSSNANLLLWKISSTIITGSPLIWSFLFVYWHAFRESTRGSKSETVYRHLRKIFYCMSIITIPLYVTSRIILLVVAFLELNNAPVGALATIDWASILPFIH